MRPAGAKGTAASAAASVSITQEVGALAMASPASGCPAAARRRAKRALKQCARRALGTLRAATLRWRSTRRCEYSSRRSSSVQPRVTWLSEPMDQAPRTASQAGRSNTPSPRLASVLGQNTTDAPVRCSAHLLRAACVACTRFQRASRAACSQQPFDRGAALVPQAVLHLGAARRCGCAPACRRRRCGASRRRPVHRAQRVQRDAGGERGRRLAHRLARCAARSGVDAKRRWSSRRPAAPKPERMYSAAAASGRCRVRRAHQRERHLQRVGVGPAVRVVVQVVELAHLV